MRWSRKSENRWRVWLASSASRVAEIGSPVFVNNQFGVQTFNVVSPTEL